MEKRRQEGHVVALVPSLQKINSRENSQHRSKDEDNSNFSGILYEDYL